MGKPSRMRREGREAFFHGEDPKILCPYKSDYNKKCWMEGWKEEEKSYINRELEKEEDDNDWQNLSFSCPWFENDVCEANNKSCEKENCASYYFKEG